MTHVLLTGVTGFVGKVVLYDLLRRSDELGIDLVTVLVRPKVSRHGSTQAPAERFESSVARSEIFRQLPAGVPGAYRLLANLVSRPRATAESTR